MPDKTQINLERIRACDAEWEESKHPRSENGQFTSGSGGGGVKVSKLQSGGKAKASSIKAGEIAKNQERYDKAHKSMAANYLSDLTNAVKGGDYETAREKLERHEKDKKRYDQLTAQNNKFKAAKATLEKARPGIRQMKAEKLGYNKLTGEKASNHPEGEAHNMMVGAMESAGGDFYTAKNKLLNNPGTSPEVKKALRKLKAPAGSNPNSIDGLVQKYVDQGKNDLASLAEQMRAEMAQGSTHREALNNVLGRLDASVDNGWIDRENYDRDVDNLLNVVAGEVGAIYNRAKPAAAPAAKPAQAGGSNQQSADKFTKVADNLKRVDSTAAKYAKQMSKVAAKSGEAAALKWAENMRAKIEADQDLLPIEKGFLGGRIDIVLKEYNKSAGNPAPQPAPSPAPQPSKKSDVGQKGIDYLRSISHVNSSAEENTGYTARNMIDMINQGKTLKEIRSEMRSNIKKHSPDIDRDLQHLDSIIAKVKRAQQ